MVEKFEKKFLGTWWVNSIIMLHTVKRNYPNVKRKEYSDKQNDYNAKQKDYNVKRNDYNVKRNDNNVNPASTKRTNWVAKKFGFSKNFLTELTLR
jgi:hypothetical protein